MTNQTPRRGHAPFPRTANPTVRSVRSRRTASGPSAAPVPCEALEGRQLLSGTTFYVAPYGSDTNAGTAGNPFRTIQAAASVAGAGDTVLIHGGTYRETVTPAHSGTATAPITFKPYGDGTVVVSGADLVGSWQPSNGPVYQAYPGWDLGTGNNEVFVDGQQVNEARWPNTSLDLSHPTLATAQSNTARGAGYGQTTTSTLTDPALTQPDGFWNGATIDVLPGQAWVGQTGTVLSSWPGGLTYKYVQMNVPYALPSAGDHYYLFGKAGTLDSPGEWSLDHNTGTLSLWAPGGDDPGNHTVEVKHRQNAFKLSSRSYVNIQGLEIFAATIATNSSSNGITLDGLDCKYVSQFALDASGWDEPTITGIQLRGHGDVLKNSLVEFSAGNGVFMDGSDNTVVNCVIHDVNTSATVCGGIDVWGKRMRVQGNTIYNSARSGVKLSTASQAMVLGNLIHDVMLQTTDGGAVYTYGTNGSGSEIGYNRIYNVHSAGYGAAGIYLDNFSNHYLVDHNVVSDCDFALKLNPPSYSNQILNNVLAYSGAAVSSSQSRNMGGTVFAGNTYTGTLSLGPGAVNAGNSAESGPGLYDPTNGGARVYDWAITPSSPVVSRPSPRPRPVPTPPVKTPPPVAKTPTPTPVVKSPAPTPGPTGRLAGYGTTVRATRGRAFNRYLGVVTDSNPTGAGGLTATVNWGDKSAASSAVLNWNPRTRRFDLTAGHTYAARGTYMVKITVKGPGGATTSLLSIASVS